MTSTLSAATLDVLAVGSLDQQRVALGRQPLGLGAGQHLDAEFGEPLGDRPRQFGIILRQDARQRLDDA